jgi:hypothetical protein
MVSCPRLFLKVGDDGGNMYSAVYQAVVLGAMGIVQMDNGWI